MASSTSPPTTTSTTAVSSTPRRRSSMFVKICGITNEDDALLAVALGADAVGFVFAPSPRRSRRDASRDIARRLPPEVITVGVFRDETAGAGRRDRPHAPACARRSCTGTRRPRSPLRRGAGAVRDPGVRRRAIRALDRAASYGADVDPRRLARPGIGRGLRLGARRGRAARHARRCSPAASRPRTSRRRSRRCGRGESTCRRASRRARAARIRAS